MNKIKKNEYLIDLNEIIDFFINLKKKTQITIFIIPFLFGIIASSTHNLLIKNYESVISLKKFSMSSYNFNEIFTELIKIRNNNSFHLNTHKEFLITPDSFVDAFYDDIINIYKSTSNFSRYLKEYKKKDIKSINPPQIYRDSNIIKVKFVYSKDFEKLDQFGKGFVNELLNISASRLFKDTLKDIKIIEQDLVTEIDRLKSSLLSQQTDTLSENTLLQNEILKKLFQKDKLDLIKKNINEYKGFRDIYDGNYFGSHASIQTKIVGLPKNQYIFLLFLAGIILSLSILIILRAIKKNKYKFK
jgi:hypothetical protein